MSALNQLASSHKLSGVMKIFTTETRVRYAETDAAQIVYYNSFFIYFELGRIEMFRELGLPYDWRLPIAETYCRYHASAKFDDLLEIHSFIEEVRRCGFRIGCRVFRADGTLLVEGYTSMVTIDEHRKPVPLPEVYRRAFDDIA